MVRWFSRLLSKRKSDAVATPQGAHALASASDIQAIMQTMLGRETTAEHVAGLQGTNATVLDIVNVIRHSRELRNNITSEATSEIGICCLPATGEDVRSLFNTLLKRDISTDDCSHFTGSKTSVLDMVKIIAGSDEFKRTQLRGSGLMHVGSIDGYEYRLPEELRVHPTELSRVLMIGSCLMSSWHVTYRSRHPSVTFDFVLFNNASALPLIDKADAAGYDFQFVQVPLRSILPEATYFHLRYWDEAQYEQLYQDTLKRLHRNLDAILQYNKQFGILTFIVNFYTPQQNPMGRMQNRYSLSNMTFFIEQINQELYGYAKSRKDVFVIDLDEIMNTFGKKYGGEDLVATINHGSILANIASEKDGQRLEGVGSVTELYGPQIDKFLLAPFEEARSLYRTIRQTDSIKLVIFDLDDTLWRGVAAELEDVGDDLIEGWPLGVLEAVSYLWRRGIMIALVSKNDQANVESIWERLYGSRFPINRFVQTAINWRSKTDNIAEILQQVNLLPNSVLFVDDNPVERAAVRVAFPEIRTMDVPVASWRRVLLWSPELQRAVVTDEASTRTEMVQAQIRREDARVTMGGDEFLASLGLHVQAFAVSDRGNKRFDRCFELINKTNQFNTTGHRWTPGETQTFFEDGGYWLVLDVADRFTNYGLTGVLSIKDATIQQFVLSCRVFGMQVEKAGIALASKMIRERTGDSPVGLSLETPKNLLSRTLFADNGFVATEGGSWRLPADMIPSIPPHITVSQDATNPTFAH